MMVADLGGGRLVPVRLEVAYESSLTIASGTFAVWVVHVASGATNRWLWIDKASGVVVRTETLAPHMPGMLPREGRELHDLVVIHAAEHDHVDLDRREPGVRRRTRRVL